MATASLTGASNVTVQQAKKHLRTRIASRLKQVPPDSVHAQSEAVLARLFNSPYYTSARSISCYLSLPHSEIQTDSLIRHALRDGKRIYVPFCPVEDKTVMRMVRLRDVDHFEALELNRWGIREVDPKEVESLEDVDRPSSRSEAPLQDSDPEGGLDLLIVPGLAFDPYRRRLGHGRGYYDRYINQYCLDYRRRFEGKKAPPRTVALALKEQMIQADEEIPTNEWDRLPDSLITPDGIYE